MTLKDPPRFNPLKASVTKGQSDQENDFAFIDNLGLTLKGEYNSQVEEVETTSKESFEDDIEFLNTLEVGKIIHLFKL